MPVITLTEWSKLSPESSSVLYGRSFDGNSAARSGVPEPGRGNPVCWRERDRREHSENGQAGAGGYDSAAELAISQCTIRALNAGYAVSRGLNSLAFQLFVQKASAGIFTHGLFTNPSRITTTMWRDGKVTNYDNWQE